MARSGAPAGKEGEAPFPFLVVDKRQEASADSQSKEAGSLMPTHGGRALKILVADDSKMNQIFKNDQVLCSFGLARPCRSRPRTPSTISWQPAACNRSWPCKCAVGGLWRYSHCCRVVMSQPVWTNSKELGMTHSKPSFSSLDPWELHDEPGEGRSVQCH